MAGDHDEDDNHDNYNDHDEHTGTDGQLVGWWWSSGW